jgi:hypothetical protein
MAKWPKDTMKAKIAFYGDPRGPHGVNNTWFSKNVIRVTPPYKMFYAGKPTKTISFHKRCVEALSVWRFTTFRWAADGRDTVT